MEKITRNWALALLAVFLVFSAVGLFEISTRHDNNRLVQDETFYYFQANQITRGNFSWLNVTQPYFYPLILSVPLMLGADLFTLRALNVLMLALGMMLLVVWVSRWAGKKTAILMAGITLIVPIIWNASTLLYTEPLFLLLASVSLLLYDAWRDKNDNQTGFLLAVVLGLLTLTRTVGFLLVALLLVHAFWTKKRIMKRFVVVPVLLFGTYVLGGGWQFLTEKSNSAVDLGNLYLMMGEAGVFFILLSGISFWSRGKKAFETKMVLLAYLSCTIMAVSVVYPRYAFFAIPMVGVLLGQQLQEKNNALKAIVVALLVLQTGYFATTLSAPDGVGLNDYWLKAPTLCVEVSDWNQSCANQTVKLPYFNQPSETTCQYETTVTTNQGMFEWSFSYASDEIEVSMDQNVVQKQVESPYSPVRFKTDLNAGTHHINAVVLNHNNVGGIGQMLICEKEFKAKQKI